MLTAEGCAGRRERLWKHLPEPCDLLIVGDPQDLIYLANFAISPFTFRSSDAAGLLLLTPDRSILVGDNQLKPFLDAAHVAEVVAPTWYNGQRSAPIRGELLVRSTLEVLAGQLPGLRIGADLASVPAALVEDLRASRPGLQFVEIGPTIRRLRRSKDPDELELLRRSARAGEAGFAAAREQIRAGMTEFEAYRIIEQACLAETGERALVYGDFVSGPRSRGSLGPPTHRELTPGDFYILDFSVVVHGYRADFANTLVVGSKPTPRQVELYEGCLAAMAAGESRLRPGVAARDVDAAVRRAFADRGLDPDYPSHSGHGIGLSHPEPPYLVPQSEDTLIAGDVVTLEPGQYAPEFGGLRFERNYRITEDGYETLTHHALTLG